MSLPTIDFSTGPATLPSVGTLEYNGCTFSPLFETQVSGNAVKDIAQRTVKYMDYSITVDGYVTLPDGDAIIDSPMRTLRDLLTAQGGTLIYEGRGMDLVVNPVGGAAGKRDVTWGPLPELLEFQPLGAGRSAKVRWRVSTRVPEWPEPVAAKPGGGPGAELRAVPGAPAAGGKAPVRGKIAVGRLLQFNYDTSVTYKEDGYSILSMKGTLEIPMTRAPNQKTRTVPATADDMRILVETRLMQGIDLSRFRVINRDFQVSRDKRTLEWTVQVEEKAYMDLPPDCSVARGSYSVRPAKAGLGLCLWLCTLRGTYTVRRDRPRRIAWFQFLLMLKCRMSQSRLGIIPALNGNQNPGREVAPEKIDEPIKQISQGRKAFLMDLSADEGLYLDSKTITFSATWRLVTSFSHILLASGLWRKVEEENEQGENLWAISMKDVQGSQSWLPNRLDPKLDVIIDFGGS